MLEIHVEAKGASARVAPVGEIDIATAPQLEAALQEAAVGGGHRVVVDLLGVTFLDVAGLRVLAGAAADARERGFEFGVMRPRGHIWSLFVLTELDEVVPLLEP